MLNDLDLNALWLTFRLAAVTTMVLLLIGAPLAWWLARTRWRWRFLVEALVALPLVLPPTVLGFYLLVAMAPDGPVGNVVALLGGPALVFSFSGLVVGSVVYSLPFVVQPLRNAFVAVGDRPLEVAAALGASPMDRFFTVGVPQARAGFLSATVLGFAHTVGEFGVVLMIGGNIPGETRVASIAIYDHVESLEYGNAHGLSLVLIVLSLVMLSVVFAVNKRGGVA
ncbi:molybdate ABC transporter permease subunit [Sulfuriroseicoccus oceanibius]|uniref:Molybdenum transport system permease n=2 Tax=Sulfuriroseicoccus oceanibius TaxID=2707525 RepID=A0A6B3L6T5_9BACT|nr:molybdate ABC transporter permease subunit [Sulfuriroseicoccus oceanibius]